jgi:hypothetical protein
MQRREKRLQETLLYFANRREKLKEDAQIYIAYMWRKYKVSKLRVIT